MIAGSLAGSELVANANLGCSFASFLLNAAELPLGARGLRGLGGALGLSRLPSSFFLRGLRCLGGGAGAVVGFGPSTPSAPTTR